MAFLRCWCWWGEQRIAEAAAAEGLEVDGLGAVALRAAGAGLGASLLRLGVMAVVGGSGARGSPMGCEGRGARADFRKSVDAGGKSASSPSSAGGDG